MYFSKQMCWEWGACSQGKCCGYRFINISGWIMVLSEGYSLGATAPEYGSSWCVFLGRACLPERRSNSLSFIKQAENEAGRTALH